MVNLLPETHRKIIEAEYRSRALLTTLYFIIIFFIIAAALLLPAYFLSREKLAVVSVDSVTVTALAKSQAEEVRREISLLNEKLAILSLEKSTLSVSEIVSLIISARGAGVYIKNMIYESRGNTSKIDVFGTAKTRDALIAFVERVKKEKKFSEVYSPISNLVKEKDIDFTVQIGITQ
ncbi:MAG: hypothetical protein AAB355_02025 [Patescibacteria group bacterium]